MNKHSPLNTIGLLSNSKPIKPRNNHHYSISYQNYHFNHLDQSSVIDSPAASPNQKNYDYILKFLLVSYLN